MRFGLIGPKEHTYSLKDSIQAKEINGRGDEIGFVYDFPPSAAASFHKKIPRRPGVVARPGFCTASLAPKKT